MRDTGVTQKLFSKIFQWHGGYRFSTLSILKTGDVRKTGGGGNVEKSRVEEERRRGG